MSAPETTGTSDDPAMDIRHIPRETPCTCHMLRRTARAMSQYYDRYLEPVGLKLPQYSVLAHTHQASSLTITELAGLLDVERTTMTRNLRPMMDNGWISVSEGIDKRSRSVSLTDAGQELFRRARPLWQEAERSFRKTLGQEDTGELRRLLDETVLNTNIQQSSAP